jgi:hypothetical protein
MELPQLHHRNERRTAMTDATHEQRSAIDWLQTVAQVGRRTEITKELAAFICSLLPDDLTKTQPALPTEPGIYSDRLGQAWQLVEQEGWLLAGESNIMHHHEARINAPFTRLVPERPQVTAAQVDEALHEAHVSGFSGDEWKETFVFALLQIINDGTPA